ncbi:MAG: T9SS type A sorting domain-containing protein [Ignavibacteria bacterium]|nr:T9SS type A sorting domain-containing protein [Ignavibacteria bacterium]
MRRFKLFSIGLLLMLCFGSFVLGQDRISLDVPIVDPTAITLDAVMNEAAWSGAAEVNLVTSAGYNIFSLYYGREGLLEPEYDEYYARLLWSEDTLFAFIHIDEIVNDSSGLYWDGQWVGDQLFVSLSNRFGVDLPDDGFEYDGNVYAAPDGPYHYLILGDQVTLNNEALTNVPEEYRKCVDQSDSQKVFLASDYTRWAVSIDTINGVWNLELAIYHPDVNAQGCVGFNIGGSQGSWQNDPIAGDAYAYYTWQPNIPDDPFGDPFGNGDPGFYNLNNSQYWAVLNFVPGPLDVKEEESPLGPPTAFNLLQNYPNPFNPTTTIKFEVPKQSAVYLKIYNVVGEQVANLVNGEVLGNGTYSVTFDAGNLSSGIYFYELRADNIIQSKKMVLLK